MGNVSELPQSPRPRCSRPQRVLSMVAIIPLSPRRTSRPRSVQRWAQASQLSQTAEPSIPAEHLGQESSPSGTPASSLGNLPLNPHGGTPAVVLDDREVSAILGKGVRSNAGEDMGL
jgi:hypothetical protein